MPQIPTRAQCLELLKKYKLPDNVIAHLTEVNRVAMELARKINARGHHVNLELVDAASLLHDIDKMQSLEGGNHGVLSRKILETEGYPEVAKIAESHVLHNIIPPGRLPGIEAKIVFYADKRVKHDKVVSIDERFKYLRERYPQYMENINRAEPLTKKLEKELMELAGTSKIYMG